LIAAPRARGSPLRPRHASPLRESSPLTPQRATCPPPVKGSLRRFAPLSGSSQATGGSDRGYAGLWVVSSLGSGHLRAGVGRLPERSGRHDSCVVAGVMAHPKLELPDGRGPEEAHRPINVHPVIASSLGIDPPHRRAALGTGLPPQLTKPGHVRPRSATERPFPPTRLRPPAVAHRSLFRSLLCATRAPDLEADDKVPGQRL